MDDEQFELWQEYYQLEPFGNVHEDIQNASILAALHEPYRDRKKRPTPFSSSDFRLGKGAQRKPVKLPAEIIKAKMTALLGPPNVSISR